MIIYKTKFGDTWDEIAYKFLGDEFNMDKLLDVQSNDVIFYYILPAGLEIKIPDEIVEDSNYFPAPWSRI